MCSVIKDLPKEIVYKLSRYRNSVAGKELIPGNTIEKPPSAELRPDQKDEDSLPPYTDLDRILTKIIDANMSLEEIVLNGENAETVKLISKLLQRSEFKRRQTAPFAKISNAAFGTNRIYPIA